MYFWHWLGIFTTDGTMGHCSPPLVGRLPTIGHTFHLLKALVIARLHVPPIMANDCKWRSWEVSPIGRTTSRNSLWLVEILIVTAWHTITHGWWCDQTRLVVRPCKTCLRLVITDRSQTALDMTVDLVATDFARTITHDHYDQWHVLSTIWQWFQHFSVVTWSHVWCDCGNRRHAKSLLFETENES